MVLLHHGTAERQFGNSLGNCRRPNSLRQRGSASRMAVQVQHKLKKTKKLKKLKIIEKQNIAVP